MNSFGFGLIGLAAAAFAMQRLGPLPRVPRFDFRRSERPDARVALALAVLCCWTAGILAARVDAGWMLYVWPALWAYVAFFIGPAALRGFLSLVRQGFGDAVRWSLAAGVEPRRIDEME